MDDAAKAELKERRIRAAAVGLDDVRHAIEETGKTLWGRFYPSEGLSRAMGHFKHAAANAINAVLGTQWTDEDGVLELMQAIPADQDLRTWFAGKVEERIEERESAPSHLVVGMKDWDEERKRDFIESLKREEETADERLTSHYAESVRRALSGDAEWFTVMARKRAAAPDLPNALEILRERMAVLNRELVAFRKAAFTTDTIPGRPPGPGARPSLARWTAGMIAGFLVKSEPPWTEPELAALFRHLGVADADRDWVHSLRRSPGLDPG